MLTKNLISLALALIFNLFISFSVYFFLVIEYKYWLFVPPVFLVIFFLLNLLSVYRSTKEDFTQFLLVSLAIKLLIALLTLLICAFLYREHFKGFSIHFVSAYIIFTVFEIRFLNQVIHSKSSNKFKS